MIKEEDCMKLLVCDLDGTLMSKNEKMLNYGIIEILNKFISENISVAIASGRNYTELKKIFCKFPDIYFIPDDGSHIVHRENTLFEMPFKNVSCFNCDFAAHGKYITFIKTNNVFLKRQLAFKYGGHIAFINSYNEINRPVYKVTVYDKSNKFPFYKVYEDSQMREFVEFSVSKGNAVNHLMDMLGLDEKECFFFGDNHNDISMLKNKTNSYAMKQSPLEVKNASRNIVDNILNELNDIYRRYCNGVL